jgi:hypothetical protein
MTQKNRIIAVIFLSILSTLTLTIDLKAESSQLLELIIDGKKFEITENEPTKISLANQRLTVEIRPKALQRYKSDLISFAFDRGFSIEDDKATRARQIQLIHASGVSVTITDHGKAGVTKPIPQTNLLLGLLETSFSRGAIKNLKRTPPKEVELLQMRGAMGMLEYDDEDNDHRICKVYVIGNARRTTSLILQYDSKGEATGVALGQTILDTIVAP